MKNGVIIIDTVLSDGQFEQFKKKWKEHYKGGVDWKNVKIIPASSSDKQLNLTAKNADR